MNKHQPQHARNSLIVQNMQNVYFIVHIKSLFKMFLRFSVSHLICLCYTISGVCFKNSTNFDSRYAHKYAQERLLLSLCTRCNILMHAVLTVVVY